MSKNCYIYETLNDVKSMKVNEDGDFMHLSGVFGVCGIKNNNQRIYQRDNYKKMVEALSERIKTEGCPGELEHPNSMNITLENVSHKIDSIEIDENGVVSGTITLLNTPKGKIAQEIVRGGLPLFISSRAMGDVDKAGNVTLEMLKTYDLVGTPGFSQAKLKLNESQEMHTLCESVCIVENKSNNMSNENNGLNESLEEKVERLESLVEALENQISSNNRRICDAVENWVVEQYSPEVEKWIVNEYQGKVESYLKNKFAPVVENWIVNEYSAEVKKWIKGQYSKKVEQWVVEQFAPEIEKWIVEQYSPEIQKWIIEQFAPEIQNWIAEEYSPVVENWIVTEYSDNLQKWMTEEFAQGIENWVTEEYSPTLQEYFEKVSPSAKRKDMLESIDETLKILENCNVTPKKKPLFESKVQESNEPLFIQKMPADVRIKWNVADENTRNMIIRKARMYNLTNESAIENFWNNQTFEPVKVETPVFENLDQYQDEYERNLRAKLRMNFKK